ncbi:MAG: hypothetical protein CVV41_19835 [Candidatus Riflebacteria bacterium HGW-Riflebacteria-1]|jgi:class 3 adenylate cyclase|nr:MAG: hypothetical protein CVV41_19835 [Candidatus Riflebacteria bacterium HGW-Riflebacteria-1]
MSEQLQIITSSNRSHTVRLFAIWLFLIVMPALVLVISFDMLLKDSEGYIKDTLKIKMVQELGDFRSKLSFARMVELKMHRLTSKTRLLDSDAESLARTINQQLQIPAVIVFHLNPQTGKFSSHVADSISARLGMLSRTMLQNYLTSVLRNSKTPSRSGSAENPAEAAKYKRSLAYLRSLFSTAGEIEIMFNRATPSFSGHPELGRLLFYAVPLENSGAALLVFRENDISLRQLAEFAANDRLFTDLQRSFTLSAEGRQAVYRLGNEMQHFSEAGDGALVVKGMASEEFLLRRVNNGTLFPARLKETLANPPLLQITAPLPSQQHPLRKVTSQAEKAALLLVILASVLLLRIFLFGYSSGLKIRTRLLLCVLGASILPFSTFIASMAYHEHFVAEFEKSEIDQYLNLQQDYLNKSLNARIDVEERKMAELAETLGRLNWQESDKYLSDWKKKSVSVLLLISSGDQEKIYTDSPDETLNATEISMKNLSFMTLRSALRPIEESPQGEIKDTGTLGIGVRGLGIVLENVGKLQETLSDNAVTLFSSFPVFAENRRFDAPTSLVLVKYYTADLIYDFLKTHPEFTRSEIRGKYRIQSCFIPIKHAFRLPPDHEAIYSQGFSPSRWSQLARHVLHSRSTSSWSDEESTAVASFHNRLQCIIINTSQRISNTDSGVGDVFLPALLYFLLMVAAMVIFMAKILIEPIDMLKRGAELVAAGNYQHRLEYNSGDEFEPLTSSFNEMTAGLYQRELLTSYVSQDVLSEVSSSMTLVPGGERVEASVVFCALKGFKEFSQSSSPEQTVKVLGRLIEVADQVANQHGGGMDKLIEDTVMLVFRQRGNDNDHVISACRAALAISQSLPDAAAPFNVAIGIASGAAVSGKIGSKTGKLDFTLIGNPVNLAARLKAQAHKAVNTGVIACPATIRLLKGQGRLLFIERTEIKGRSRTFPLYELVELR